MNICIHCTGRTSIDEYSHLWFYLLEIIGVKISLPIGVGDLSPPIRKTAIPAICQLCGNISPPSSVGGQVIDRWGYISPISGICFIR